MGKLGLRYPPASSVDRDSHAARVALLAEDCADIDNDWLDLAARQWAKNEPFMPRACEMRELALSIGRMLTPAPQRPIVPYVELPPKPDEPPLTDEEIARLPKPLIEMGLKFGEITPEQVARIGEA